MSAKGEQPKWMPHCTVVVGAQLTSFPGVCDPVDLMQR